MTDENNYQAAAIQYGEGDFRPNLQHPPLAKELMAISDKLFGPSWAIARIPSALAGVATAVIMYAWARRAGGGWAGVAALVLSGVVPQRAGIPGLLQLSIATRVDRFALLDPVATVFAALALWAGWRWMMESGLPWALLAGLASGFAAASKAPGILVAPTIVGFSLWSGYRSPWRFTRQLAGYVGAGIVAVAIAYVPLGFHGAFHQLHYMFVVQSRHGGQGHAVYLAGKTYRHVPWWAGLYHQTVGYGLLVTLVGIVLIAAAIYAYQPRRSVVYGLTGASVIYVGLVFTRLELPFYYVLWQPGLVFTAALGVGALLRRRYGRMVLVASSAALAVPVVALGVAVGTVGPGAYERAARLATCRDLCVANVVGKQGVLRNYLPRGWIVRNGIQLRTTPPDLVVADPNITLRRPAAAAEVDAWRTAATKLGYRHEVIDRLEVWVPP